VTRKPTKTREELAAHVLKLLRASPECSVVTGVVIAPVLPPKPGYAKPSRQIEFVSDLASDPPKSSMS